MPPSDPLAEFFAYCQRERPGDETDLERYFEGVVCFPVEEELLLQAWLWFHRHRRLPRVEALLLFEHALVGQATEHGKCDFLFRTGGNRILAVETKYIERKGHGRKHRRKRTGHRRKVREQIEQIPQVLHEHWKIPPEAVDRCIFTTDPVVRERVPAGVEVQVVEPEDLQRWQRRTRKRLRAP